MSRAENDFRKHKAHVEAFFDRARASVYTDVSLHAAIAQNRAVWQLSKVAVAEIAALLLHESRLKVVTLASAHYASVYRYVWDAPSPFEMALSLRSSSYLSYGTAACLWGLLKDLPATFYVNKEQSPKEQFGQLTQDALDRAFSSRPRQSKLVYSDDNGHEFVVIAGKCTNALEVGAIRGPNGERLQATKLERTLIAVTVRPIYCGGVRKVLEAYETARVRLSPKRLMATLKKLGHLYPYHQAVGFYLERAGYSGEALDMARQPGLEFDFYLTHGMGDSDYNKAWRLYHPRGL